MLMGDGRRPRDSLGGLIVADGPRSTSTRCDKQVKRIGYGSHGPSAALSLKVDPTKLELYTGMLNTGHTFGDDLTEEQRLAVLEFLKCL